MGAVFLSNLATFQGAEAERGQQYLEIVSTKLLQNTQEHSTTLKTNTSPFPDFDERDPNCQYSFCLKCWPYLVEVPDEI